MDHQLAEQVAASFEERFGTRPLLVWSPGRINIIGEHTDYNLGYVLPAAIDRGMVMALGKSESGHGKWIAADVEEEYIQERTASDSIKDKGWSVYLHGILAELGKKGIHPGPVDLVFSGNIPPGAGLSSSAALENAFVFGLNELFQLGLSPMEMVRISHAAEQNYAGVQCGIMDQYTGMFGEEGKAIFLDCRSLRAEKIPVEIEGCQWLLLDTGVKHSLADSAYNQRRKVCEHIAARLGVTSLREAQLGGLEEIQSEIGAGDYQMARYVLEENTRVLRAVEALREKDFQTLGKLLYLSHEGLSKQYRVSCDELNFLVDLAREADGVLGARMMGGGFGGCTLNLVAKGKQDIFVKTAKEAYTERFGASVSPYLVILSDGCSILH